MPNKHIKWVRWSTGVLVLASTAATAEYGVNFPAPASGGAEEIYDVHMLTFGIATVLMVIVTAIVAYSVWAHRKSRGFEADQHFHETWFGRWGWMIVPALVLGVDMAIAGSAQKTLIKLWEVPDGDDMLDVKVTGHQWWWQYDYVDAGVRIESRALPKEKAGDLYLRAVDNPLVLPTHTRIRFLHTSADVNHAFWVPELGFKKDAIAGYVTETWANIEREGTYRGQCAELCGTWHSRMPVVVKAVSREKFDAWLKERQAAAEAAAAAAASDKQWEKTALMDRGKETFNTKCAACHQADGTGMPPAIPALKGSKVALGPVADHIKVVLEGRPGTAMQSWKDLNDLDIASLITYERNAWGNDTGDVIQPKQVAGMRSDTQSAAR
jgi:cytochrome c oxidase subunit 2